MDIKDIKYDIAFQTLADGPISMYHSIEILSKDIEWYKANNYRVFDFDTSNWTISQAHLEMKERMDFGDYYGKNLNAFNDCLGDTFNRDFKGQVLLFRNFDKFSKKEKEFCLGLLDIISQQSRKWLLLGQRLIGIIQSDDPHIYFEKIGGNPPYWNRKEWLDASRIKK